MKLKIIANPRLSCLSLDMLKEFVANTIVQFDCTVKPVAFQPGPPADTTVLWQQTDGCGGAHLGPVKTFKNGEWK